MGQLNTILRLNLFFLHVVPSWTNTENHASFNCESQLNAFSDEQRQFCRRQPEVMPYLVHGASDALRFCRREMAAEQWDCSSAQGFEGDGRAVYVQDDGGEKFRLFAGDFQDFTPDMFGTLARRGSREAAFLSAIRAAGMVDSLILAYWNKELPSPIQGHFDDTYLDIVKYARNLVAEFLSFDDLPPRGVDGWYLAQHNVDVGLTVVERLITCDGSDPRVRRCGARLEHFTWIAERLHDLYDQAVKVKVHHRPQRVLTEHHFEELPADHAQNSVTQSSSRKRRSYVLKSQLDESTITNEKLDVDARQADVDYPNTVFLGDLKLYYIVDSPMIEEYCRNGVKKGRTCFRQWTRRSNRSWSQYSTPFIHRAIKRCRLLCCNQTLQEVWIRYHMRGDDSITVDHVCP